MEACRLLAIAVVLIAGIQLADARRGRPSSSLRPFEEPTPRVEQAINATDHHRSGKFFSLFSIVRFANSRCSGTNGLNGTCFTSAECARNGGTASGSCASGFGVCCTITLSACGSTVTLNNTYWTNADWPSAYTTAGQCSLYVNKCATNICQIRLDFHQFQLAGPSESTAAFTATECLTDIFTVSGSSNTVPGICGSNNGHHIYLDMLAGSNAFVLNMLLSGTTTSRNWNIQVSQIPCGTTYSAPESCLQWFTEATGTIQSFNYENGYHLANQDYAICIRMNQGFCGICYTACNTTSFDVSTESGSTVVDNLCLTDFIMIPCGNDQQDPGQIFSGPGQLALAGSTIGAGCVGKICGGTFAAVFGTSTPAPVYSYRKPFEVRFYTDNSDLVAGGSLGFCLNYSQLPCSTTSG